MSLTYSTWVTTVANLAVVDETDTNLVQILPSTIDYAEQRIYRELDLLDTVTRQTGTLVVGPTVLTLPTSSGRFVVTNNINVITPSTTTNPDLGTRNQCIPVSRDYIYSAWPDATVTGLPTCYAMISDQAVIFGPPADATYTVEVVGTIRPTPLSASNTTTYLTLYLPDLFVAASMVFISGYLKNYSSQSDDPKMSTSWESQYQALFASANVEEQRKRYASGAWSSMQPTTIATPTR
jgi:hypothetical protein